MLHQRQSGSSANPPQSHQHAPITAVRRRPAAHRRQDLVHASPSRCRSAAAWRVVPYTVFVITPQRCSKGMDMRRQRVHTGHRLTVWLISISTARSWPLDAPLGRSAPGGASRTRRKGLMPARHALDRPARPLERGGSGGRLSLLVVACTSTTSAATTSTTARTPSETGSRGGSRSWKTAVGSRCGR